MHCVGTALSRVGVVMRSVYVWLLGACVCVCVCLLGGVLNIKVQNINSPRGKLVVSKTILH